MSGSQQAEGVVTTDDVPRSKTLVETLHSGVAKGPDGPPLGRGVQVGRYVVIDRLGAGGMGVVYSAYDPELDRKVAIKLLRGEDHAGESRGRSRLLREAQALARVSHPNVVTVHDVGTHDGRVFIAMTFVRGPTLARWVAEEERSWREILDVYLDAGEGLLGIHRVGLVHRDFKPDNVMIDRRGRVQVMDLGLARSEEDVEQSSGPRPVHAPADGLATPLTQTGALIGTPAYMAPEQHLGLPADARSDQFSFCVSLYEGLYGERPFKGATVASLGLAISSGSIVDPPRGNKVPSWVRRVLLRGLSNVPEERWPSFEALLEALRDDPVARTRRRASLGAGVVAVALLGWGVASAMQPAAAPPPVCTGSQSELERSWNEDRAAALDAAFDQTGLPFAGDAARTVRRSLDDWGGRWTTMHREACEATRVQGSQSERMLDRRMACLQGRLDGVEAVLAQLEQGGPEAVEGAVEAVTSLPSVEGCGDLEALERGLEPPEDPAVAAQVEEVRSLLRRARAAERAGSASRASELAAEGLTRAEATDYAPVLAEAEHVAGLVALEAGDYEAAEDHLARAYFRGLEEGHEPVAADAAAHLVYVIGYRRQAVERGLEWLPHAEALARRTDPDGLGEATMSHLSGAVLDGKGDHDEAQRRYLRALEIRSQRLPADHPDTARTLNNLGNIEMGKGDYARAEDYYQRARAMREALFGPAHPEVGGSLNNLSLTRTRAGDTEGAIDLLSRAVDIYQGAYGDHADTAQAMNNLAINLIAKGELARARSVANDSLRIRKKVLGEEHADLGDTEMTLGQISEAEGDHEAALEWHRAALAHYEGSFDEDHPAVFSARVAVGRCQLALGQSEDGEKTLALALEQGGGGVPPDEIEAAKKLLAD